MSDRKWSGRGCVAVIAYIVRVWAGALSSPGGLRYYRRMLVPLSSDGLETVRSLFDDVAGLHGCLDAALEGSMGEVLVDDREEPSLARIELDFYFVGGDANAPKAADAVRDIELPASIVTAGEGWDGVLRDVWGGALLTRTRVAFEAGEWDRARLAAFQTLPDGFELRRVARRDARRFDDLAESLVYNFESLDDFVDRGVGFGVEHDGRYVSGCSSFAISSHSLEFEIQTHPDYRRRGFALAAASAMIEYCLDEGLEPCWDAHNEMSAALAEKLGFVNPRPYTAYELPPSATPLS